MLSNGSVILNPLIRIDIQVVEISKQYFISNYINNEEKHTMFVSTKWLSTCNPLVPFIPSVSFTNAISISFLIAGKNREIRERERNLIMNGVGFTSQNLSILMVSLKLYNVLLNCNQCCSTKNTDLSHPATQRFPQPSRLEWKHDKLLESVGSQI